ncbi:KxYKxGKxW signal peptide domain-containing protein, partial [Weissella halotolerans]
MIEHKKMYKAGKRWLTGSLTLLAGGVFLQSMGTQAAADSVTENWHANSVTEVKEAIKGQDLKNYVLAKGDTVWAISQATGMSVQEIATTFHLQDVDHVLAGQTLMLTGQEAQALAQKLVRADETAGDTQSSQTASSQVEETNDSSSVADQTTKEQAAATASANAQAAADQAAKEQAAATASANAQAAADQAAKE